ncbi:glycosyltransferase family 2 protein, partial [bacterium]|nr:glycosyltransferase family 2 protein [bacterium]
MPEVCVIILNYNGWADTIECLESLLQSTYGNYQIVVVDNASTDNSLIFLKAWADDRLSVFRNQGGPLKLSLSPKKKLLSSAVYKQAELSCDADDSKVINATERIIFIGAEKNRGYAAGNNIGLRWALIKNSFAYCWLLNNDTVIACDCLEELVRYARDNHTAITGCSLFNYAKPATIQSLGGHINRFFGTSHPILKMERLKNDLDYIEGAALLIEKGCLNRNGLLPEEYFLYFEEVDYCFKVCQNQFRLGVALKAVVYHKTNLISARGSTYNTGRESEFLD